MSTEKITGYHDIHTLPIKRGDKVRIPKGTMVRSMKNHNEARPAGRSFVVTVHSMACGQNAHVYRGETVAAVDPAVVWPGTGGYWCECSINDVEKVED